MLDKSEVVLPDGVGLTDDQYADLSEATQSIAHQVILEQFGPYWSAIEVAETAATYFDACHLDDYAIRVVNIGGTWGIQRMVPSSTTWVDVTLTEQPTCPKGIVSLAATGVSVALFYYNGSAICRMLCSNIEASTPSFAAHTTLISQDSVNALAAVGTGRCYGSFLNGLGNYVLFSIDAGSEWAVTDSGVSWPFPFDSLDAASISDRDYIGMSTDLPPLWGTRAVNVTEVQSSFSRVQGIVIWSVSNGRWSDYRAIDVIDLDVYGYSRLGLRLTSANGILFASYYRHTIFRKKNSDNTIMRSSQMSGRSVMVLSRSVDGFNWDFPEISLMIRNPTVIIPRQSDLLAICSNRTFRSNPCSWAGQTPASQDLTSYVLDIRSTAGDMRTSTIELANPYIGDDGTPHQALDGTLVNLPARLQLKLYLGYWIDSPGDTFILDSSLLDGTDVLA